MRRDQARFLRFGIGGASVLLVVALGALLANVSSGASPPTSRSDVFTVTFADKGKTVDLRVGETLRVVLDNTYWSTNPPSSNSASLVQRGEVRVYPRLAGCVAGEGCGTVITLFRATAAGTAMVSASRVSCGEALRCTGGNGSFEITVRIQ
jgi:hypothetical protein